MPRLHHDLGEVLQEQRDLPEAVKHYRIAAELEAGERGDAPQPRRGPDEPGRHARSAAEACFQLSPWPSTCPTADSGPAPSGNLLGQALQHLGKDHLRGAIDNLRRAVELTPEDPYTHNDLGSVLAAQGNDRGAIASYGRALDFAPEYALAHCSLGDALLREGDFHKALAEYKKGHDLGSQRKDWPYDSALAVKRCESFIELDGRLPAILKREVPPSGTGERIMLAELCQYKKLYASSVRFWTEAFAADAKLANDFRGARRYRAACVAALAGSGQGEEAARLDPAGRARQRRQALEWLRADLAAWDEYLKGRTVPDPSSRGAGGVALLAELCPPGRCARRTGLAALPSEGAARRKWHN